MRAVPDPPKIPDSEMETMIKTRRRMRPRPVPNLRSEEAIARGPMVVYQHCGFVTQEYRDNYDRIFGK